MNYKQKAGLMLFLCGSFGRMEWHIRGADNSLLLTIFTIAILVGILIFSLSEDE